MKHSLWVLAALVGAWTGTAGAADMRRISLDGREGATAPVAKPGKDGIDRIQKVETPCLELFVAGQQPAKGTVLLCPGGGYRILAIHHEGYAVAKMLNEIGYDVAILIYHVNVGDDTRELAFADVKDWPDKLRAFLDIMLVAPVPAAAR